VYDYLEGVLRERRATHVTVDVGGVGYDVAVPLGADFPQSDGRSRVWTHLVVREDAQLLFGFPGRQLREVFRLLLSVRGVGPSVALAVLSRLSGEELLRTVTAQDPAPLLAIKGIGKKTAEQILLDLGDKAPRFLGQTAADVLVPRPAPTRVAEDAVRALVSVGYSEKEAQKSVERAAGKAPGADLEHLVRAALQE